MVQLIIPVLVTTITAADFPASCQIYLLFVTIDIVGNSPDVLLEILSDLTLTNVEGSLEL